MNCVSEMIGLTVNRTMDASNWRHNPCRHRLGYWRTLECRGGGGGGSRPLLSREPLVVESRAIRHSKALHKTRQNHLSELKIEVTCEVKVRSGQRSKSGVLTFWALGTRIIEPDGSNSGKMLSKGMVKVWYENKWHTKKTSRSRSGHKRYM